MKKKSSGTAGGPWSSFFVAVLFLLLFPLFPLGAELLFTEQITASSLMLVTATYAISLSMSCRNVAIWAIGFALGVVFSTAFGWAIGMGDQKVGPVYTLKGGVCPSGGWFWVPAGMIALVFVLHFGERFQRHVQKQEPFPEFLRR